MENKVCTWRDGEKSHKQFTQLTKEEKQNYISFLLALDTNVLSFNDKIILEQFAPKQINKTIKFLEL
jgi:hypothetical protein